MGHVLLACLLSFLALLGISFPKSNEEENEKSVEVNDHREYCMLATNDKHRIYEIVNNPDITVLDIREQKNGDTYVFFANN